MTADTSHASFMVELSLLWCSSHTSCVEDILQYWKKAMEIQSPVKDQNTTADPPVTKTPQSHFTPLWLPKSMVRLSNSFYHRPCSQYYLPYWKPGKEKISWQLMLPLYTWLVCLTTSLSLALRMELAQAQNFRLIHFFKDSVTKVRQESI